MQGGKWGKIVPCPDGEAPEPPRGKSNSPPPPPTEALLKMRCNAHKREDDIDVVHQRCMGSPTCRRRPVRSWVQWMIGVWFDIGIECGLWTHQDPVRSSAGGSCVSTRGLGVIRHLDAIKTRLSQMARIFIG